MDCPYGADHPSLLDVHHLDGDRANGNPDNLVTLCALCHRLVTYGVSELHLTDTKKGGWHLTNRPSRFDP